MNKLLDYKSEINKLKCGGGCSVNRVSFLKRGFQMKVLERFYPKGVFYTSFFITIFLIGVIFGQTYQLEWSTMDAGGNEAGDSIYSTNFRLTSAIGQGTAIGDSSWISSTNYLVHPGFRKIDLDWRPSFTQLLGTVTLVDAITVDTVLVQWTGQDTTTEEGPGWGIWMYDVQYHRDDSSWTDWLDSTFDTSATMTGLTNGHWYYFRVRAHDLATNVGDWDTINTIIAIDSVFVNTALYSLELHTTDELCSLWVDGTSYPAPFIQNYSGGTAVHIDVADSVNFGDTIIAIFDHWAISAGTDTFLDITMTDNTVDTAVYNLFYSLDVTSDNDTPVPNGHNFYPEGDSVSGYITDPIVDIGGGLWAVCTGFSGTGSAPSIGSGPEFFIDSLLQPSSITWVWDTISDTTSLCTLVVFSPYGHPMPADTTVYPPGTSIMAQVENMVVMGTDTHYCTGWLGGGSVSPTGVGNSFGFVITENSWIVWCWDSDCKLPLIVENDGMSFDPTDGYDTPTPTVGLHWYSPDTLINASVTTPADGMQCVGYWGSGSVASADSATSVSFYLDSPSWIHWRWFDEDTAIVCLTVWSEYDSPNPPMGTSCYPIGADIHATVAESTYEGGSWHHCTGYWGSGSAPTDTSGIDPTPYDITFTLDVNSQLVWVWDGALRFPLVVTNDGVTPSDPDGYDTPTPFGLNWFDAGSDVNCSVTSPADGMQCLGHIGTGSASTDTSTNFTFAIDEPSEVYWYWESDTATIVYLTVYSEYGDPEPPIGTIGYHIGTSISAFVQDSAFDGSSWHYNSGWTGSGSVPSSGDSNSVDFTINTNSWIVWQWDGTTRWPFVVISAHDTPVPSVGTHWFDDGDSVIGSIDLVDGVWRCLGYNGWGDLGSEPYNHFGFAITQPSGVEWIWDTLTNVRQLIVRKDPDTDTWGGIAINGDWSWGVSAETVYVTPSAVVSIGVSNPDVSGLSRYSFVQWSDGATDTNRTETITSDAEFVANYDYQHFVVVQKDPTGDTYGHLYIDASSYSGAASVYQEFWWADGSSHDIAVSPLDTTSTSKYTFSQWEDASTDSARTVTITEPDTFTASYSSQYLIVIQKVDSVSGALEPHGCIYTSDTTVCGVGEYSFWADGGSSISFAVSEKDTVGDSLYTFYRWMDGGTDTVHSSFTVDSADTYTAMYEGMEYVICVELHQHSTVPESVIWIPSPSDTIIDPTATYSMTASDVITVHNCGTVDNQLWLGVISCKDTLGADVPWAFTMNGGDRNNISLRGRFENSATAPSFYSPVLDYLKFATMEKATDASETPSPIFGPYGGRLNTSQDIYLFFQLVSPSSSDYYGLVEIKVGLKATIRLP